MALQESGEMYLETILILSKEKNVVRAIDIADYMDFSKPSVSRALNKLREEKYIITDSDGYIAFTETGRKAAERVYRMHVTLTQILVGIGVDEDRHDRAEEDDKALRRGSEAEEDDDQRDEGDAGCGRQRVNEYVQYLAEGTHRSHQKAERDADEDRQPISADIDLQRVEECGEQPSIGYEPLCGVECSHG